MLLSSIVYDREDRAQKYLEMQAKKKAGERDQSVDEDDPLKALKEI
jgi:hypothetical protein